MSSNQGGNPIWKELDDGEEDREVSYWTVLAAEALADLRLEVSSNTVWQSITGQADQIQAVVASADAETAVKSDVDAALAACEQIRSVLDGELGVSLGGWVQSLDGVVHCLQQIRELI